MAFSGGVDSAFLIYCRARSAGRKTFGNYRNNAKLSAARGGRCCQILQSYGVKHAQIELNQLVIPGFCRNGAERCYYCKYALFSEIKAEAAKHGITAVADGANTDDENDYRPGMRATAELGILSRCAAPVSASWI